MKLTKPLALVCAGALLASCANHSDSNQAAAPEGASVSIENCGQERQFPLAEHMLVNDGNLIASTLSVGAADQIKAVSSIQRDTPILSAKYGEQTVAGLDDIAKEYPSLEQIIAEAPDVYVAGWGYGLDEGKGITPESLQEHDIATYILSEACRQGDSSARGTMDPWEAVEQDLHNLGALTGHEDKAEEVIKDQQQRLEALRAAPKAEQTPVAFLYDSGTDALFTSGKYGAPQAILATADASNATEDIEDTWVSVGWERLAQAAPDVFVFVEYPGQELDQKIEQLKKNPATKNLPAVKEERFINLPYAMWTSGPLNIDAAEHVRKALEYFKLVPESDIEPALTLPSSTPGLKYFQAS
ncbi:ABC transporter substrate-binding protein [Corynebacterium pseudopelargi]|uniref:Vitamin B12-transporter protein BtuF n=1 Tax=Corynebacterium pseudopelargi TaxID=2080757 RepID=A0A3G6IXR4_9CORY|nr:ABC transporter substrate-binding protein [Corynebacterium pseudopelargi]AZA09438.1 vitamin B12-transporter protein BtuF [Corynebacterium pseudopelargi]